MVQSRLQPGASDDARNRDLKTSGGWKRPCAAWVLAVCAALPVSAIADAGDWSVGAYAGKYHDTEPAGLINGKTRFLEHYLVALTASKTLWRSSSMPLSLEIDGMLGQQSGLVNLTEIAVAPALRWGGFPWRETLQTDLRLAPLGISYTSTVSPLERGPDGRGSRMLNYLFIEVALSKPQAQSDEWFLRIHHRCAIYDLLNQYGANGEDFLTVGYRVRF